MYILKCKVTAIKRSKCIRVFIYGMEICMHMFCLLLADKSYLNFFLLNEILLLLLLFEFCDLNTSNISKLYLYI